MKCHIPQGLQAQYHRFHSYSTSQVRVVQAAPRRLVVPMALRSNDREDVFSRIEREIHVVEQKIAQIEEAIEKWPSIVRTN